MDPLWIAVAFVLGFAARQVGLPPLVGFLVAGFVLNGFGAESGNLKAHFGTLQLNHCNTSVWGRAFPRCCVLAAGRGGSEEEMG